jgi:RNase P protein component
MIQSVAGRKNKNFIVFSENAATAETPIVRVDAPQKVEVTKELQKRHRAGRNLRQSAQKEEEEYQTHDEIW